MDRDLGTTEVRIAMQVVKNMVPGLDEAFGKVAGELANAAGTPDVKVRPDVVNSQSVQVNDNPADAFMVNYATREIKNKKLTKGGVTPSPSSVFNGEGNRRAIAGVSAGR